MIYGQEKLAGSAVALWKRRGLDTLVKVLPYLAEPDPGAPVGICTTLRFVVGLRAPDMVEVAAVAHASDLAAGAEIFTVAPLPAAGEFAMTGYAPTRPPPPPPPPPPADDGEADAPPPRVAVPPAPHPLYLPGRGAPLWNLAGVPQARLVRLASVPGGAVFQYEPRLLPPLP